MSRSATRRRKASTDSGATGVGAGRRRVGEILAQRSPDGNAKVGNRQRVSAACSPRVSSTTPRETRWLSSGPDSSPSV